MIITFISDIKGRIFMEHSHFIKKYWSLLFHKTRV